VERRGFLKGLFGGVTASGLIVMGKRHEVQAFAAPLRPEEPIIIDVPSIVTPAEASRGLYIYNSRGEALGFVQAFDINTHRSQLTRIEFSVYADGEHDDAMRHFHADMMAATTYPRFTTAGVAVARARSGSSRRQSPGACR
jgi:hypothetical protein